MALDKITTDIIADDAVTAAKIVAGAVEVDIRAGSVTGDKIGYLGDGTGNLSGTIANQQLHFGTAFTLTDNLTVNGDLTLGKVRDDGLGQSLTGSGRTLSGTGTLTMGSSVERADRVTTLRGDSGSLGSGVTFPAGHVIQTFTSGTTPMANTYSGTASTDIQIAPTGITSGNKILLIFSGELSTNNHANTTNFVNNIYLEGTAAESGLGSTTSGPNFVNEYGRYSNDWAFINYNITILTAAVTTATPTYRLYHNYTNPDTAFTLYYTNWYATAFEIQQ